MALMPLSAAFLSGLSSNPNVPGSELEAQLEGVLVDCRAAWPSVNIEPARFMKYLAEHLPADADPAAALKSLHVADLYLACACVLGDRSAVSAFDATYIERLASVPLAGMPRAKEGDELAQRLRVRMLVGESEQPPKIASYSGRGTLAAWLRVAAARMAVDLYRAEKATTDPVWSMRGVALDQELLYVKQTHAEEFSAAVEEALAGLTTRARTILRLHFLEGVPVAQIARSYNVSARSVQRWIVAAQQQISEHLRFALAARLEVSSSQLDSLIGAMETEMVMALRQFFNPKR